MQSNETQPVFYGRLSDGKSARSEDVDVRLGAEGVEFVGQNTPRAVWPYDSLSAAEPLTDHAIDALLASKEAPGAWLFVGEGTFARALAKRAPQLSARALRWRHARPWVFAAAAAVLVALAIPFFGFSPARAIANLMPDKARTTLGKEVIQSMTSGRRICEAPAGRAALDRLTARLTDAAGGTTKFKVVVSDWDLLNAFAAPGEQIVLTRQLIKKAESSNEIAGILAHEMGHGLERHPETAVVRAIGFSAGLELLMGGSGGTLANAGLLLAHLSYSREAEREADAHALQILKAAGIPARGLSDFFRRVIKLEKNSNLGDALSKFEFLRTHPNTEERIAAVENAPTYEATVAMSATDWKALKNICKDVGDGKRKSRKHNRPNRRFKKVDPGRDI